MAVIFKHRQCQKRHTTPLTQQRQRQDRLYHRRYHRSSPPNTTAHGAEGEGQRADMEAGTVVAVEAGAVAGTAQGSSRNRPNSTKEEDPYQPWSRHHSRLRPEGNRIASIIINDTTIGTCATAAAGTYQAGTRAQRVPRNAVNTGTKRDSHATTLTHIFERDTIHRYADGTKICFRSRGMNGANDS